MMRIRLQQSKASGCWEILRSGTVIGIHGRTEWRTAYRTALQEAAYSNLNIAGLEFV